MTSLSIYTRHLVEVNPSLVGNVWVVLVLTITVSDPMDCVQQLVVETQSSINSLIVSPQINKQQQACLDAESIASHMMKFVHAVARHPRVSWMEGKLEMKTMDIYSNEILQGASSGPNGSFVVWDQGLHGENQIVGVTDTGIDYDMCFL